MSNIVRVSVMPPGAQKIRVENVDGVRRVEIGPFTFQDESGAAYPVKFLDDLGKSVPLVIDGIREFDLDKDVDAKNWESLRKFKQLEHNPIGSSLIMIDPGEDDRRKIRIEEEKMIARDKIRSIKDSEDKLKTVYRRVFGPNSSIGSMTAYSVLLDLVNTDHERFFVNGKFITDDSEFDNLAIIDELIEDNVLLVDADGSIRTSDSNMFAKSVNDASFRLKNDTEKMKDLKALAKIERERKKGRGFAKKEDPIFSSSLVGSIGIFADKDAEDGDKGDDVYPFNRQGAAKLVESLIEQKMISESLENGISFIKESEAAEEIEKDVFIDVLAANEGKFEAFKSLIAN